MISQPFSIGETQPIDGFGSMPSAQMPPSTQRHGGVGMGPPSRPANRANEASSSVFPLSSIPESLMEEPDDPIQHQASNQHTLAGFNDFPDLPLQEETTQQRAEQENASQGITDAEMEDIDGEELQDEEVKGEHTSTVLRACKGLIELLLLWRVSGGDAGSDGGRAASEDPISSFPSQALPANPAASNDAEVESIQATQSQQIDTTSQARRQTRSSRRRSSDIVSSSAEITTQSPSKNAPQPAATAEPAQAEEIVACDCDDLVTDGLMIQCEVCEFWVSVLSSGRIVHSS